MVDSVNIIGPGWRATNSSGAIITDGILEFFDAGTTNARTVYYDADLLTSLGTTVSCNSGGYPVSSGNARTLVYTGASAYKVRLTSVVEGGTVWEHDNVVGAVPVSTFLTSAAVADQSTIAVSSDRAITVADKGKIINANCTGATFTLTYNAAATLGDGFYGGVRHDGTANQVKITGNGTDTFSLSSVDVTGFSLRRQGHVVWITCDGTNFAIDSEMPPLISGTSGVIVITDRLSAPPGSPTPGARYILTSSPTGDWSGFSEHDIAEADGFGNWFNYTPPTDIGWIAYVQDEDLNYQFRGAAWASFQADDDTVGMLEVATDAEVALGSSLNKAVVPGRQHSHNSAVKFWVSVINSGGGGMSIDESYNVTSITDSGVGDLTVTVDVNFSSSTGWVPTIAVRESGSVVIARSDVIGAGTLGCISVALAGSATDPDNWFISGVGEQ